MRTATQDLGVLFRTVDLIRKRKKGKKTPELGSLTTLSLSPNTSVIPSI